MPSDRTFYSIICDDIRHEVGDKISLMGCYSGVMFVNEFPAALPKLGAYTRIVADHDDLIQSIRVRFFFQKKLLGQINGDLSQIKPERIGDRSSYQIAMVCGPINMEEAGDLRVEVETENDALVSETIKVMLRSDRA
ncbi:hypothetical protein FH712_16630 [Marinobacter nauticus]|uniref:DUF6941 family protein n=1 Tax=Marinobacter nauticus TaxID=2743 RepID=UPI00112F833B|nr:hypothetical protein [Marinobacter nauticus]TPW22566.1 hypothetical protein FH712_16630 [Marinobacter nauticus]